MLPAIFVSHGAPSLVLEDGPTQNFLRQLGAEMNRPRAIVCVSSHWETDRVKVGQSDAPQMIYDFHGFPRQLYQVQYPAPGDPALGAKILQSLAADGIDAAGDASRGFDHGVWTPLVLMFPDASIPVLPISVQPNLSARHHFAVGRALGKLREENVLILGSGTATHNLAELRRGSLPPHTGQFENWLCDSIVEGRAEDLIDWDRKAPHALRNHPTPEHFLSLFAPLGASSDPRGRILHRRFEFGAISMAAFAWD